MKAAATSLVALVATVAALALAACATAPTLERLEDTRQGTVEQWRGFVASDPSRAARAIGRMGRPELAAILLDAPPSAHAEVAFALGQIDSPTTPQALTGLARSTDPGVRSRALEAMGKRLELADVRILLGHLADPAAEVRRASALALARKTGRRSKQPSPLPEEMATQMLDGLKRRLNDPDPDVRWAVVYALSEIDLPGRIASLRIAASTDDPRSRLFAVRGLSRAGGDAGDFVLRLTDPDSHVAAAAASGLAKVGRANDVPALEAAARRAAHPGDHHVRDAATAALVALGARPADTTKPEGALAVLEALLEKDAVSAEDRRLALREIEKDDVAIRDTAVRLLAKAKNVEDLVVIERAFDGSPGDENAEVRATAVRAVTEHYNSAAVPLLRRALSDPSPAVAHAAGAALLELTGEAPPASLAAGRASSVEPYRGSPARPQATLHTVKGAVTIELLGDQAPRHVQMFLEFAESGRYDGLTFHRVISGFVAQGLDPRGDGWGTGGVFLRDEINPIPYLAGAVGMPNAGPDSGGCQIFITHVPTPHLDGRYTVFGRVTEGMDVVHALAVGDVVERVTTPR